MYLMNLRFQYCQIDEWFTSHFQKWIISFRIRGESWRFFLKIFICAEIYWIILINQKYLLSWNMNTMQKMSKLELGQIEIYILPLHLIEHEWIHPAKNPTEFSTLFSLLPIRWINYLRQELWSYLFRCSKDNIRQFVQNFFTISWSCKIQPH